MRYSNNPAGQQALRTTVGNWFNRARQVQLHPNWGAWIGMHQAGALLYNCGGIQGPGRHNGWGNDYVTQSLFNWLTANIPNSYAVTNLPHAYPSGQTDTNGAYEYLQDYYNVTRIANQNYAVAANTLPAPGNAYIPAGNYQITLNFHLYVDDRYPNPAYQPPDSSDSDHDGGDLGGHWPTPAEAAGWQ